MISSNEKFTVFEIFLIIFLLKLFVVWVLNLENYWFDELILLMFQKEVADRIIAKENT